MKREIFTSTALDPLGNGLGRHLHRGPVGRYANRLAAIVQVASSQIVLTYADPPYLSWTTPMNVAIDAADMPFDTLMISDGSIRLVYTENSTNYLVTRPFTFANGQWTPGSKSVIYDGAVSQYPSISIDNNGVLWVAWARSVGAIKYLHIKSSNDNGVTWGTGPTDAGEQLTAGASSVYARLITSADALHAVYTEADWNILIRTRPVSTGSWATAYTIAGSDVSGTDFSAAISKSGLIGVVFNRNELQYREYDGNIWGAIQILDVNGGSLPHIVFQDDFPIITYLAESGTGGRRVLKFVTRSSGIFDDPTLLDKHTGSYARLLLYSASSQSYHDATSSASNDNVADVYHPSSNALLSQQGDRLYCGLTDRFRILNATLSTAGVGGTVSYCYWDGTSWRAFDPHGGAYHMDATDKELTLWADYHGIPADWQQSVIDGTRLFWIKIEVTAAYTTGPVGTRFDATLPVSALAVRR